MAMFRNGDTVSVQDDAGDHHRAILIACGYSLTLWTVEIGGNYYQYPPSRVRMWECDC